MRQILIFAALLGGVAVAAPGAARSGVYPPAHAGGTGIERHLSLLAQLIRRAEDRDVISRREEDRLLRRTGRIRERLHLYLPDGLSAREHRDLQHRIQNLRQRMREAGRDDRYQDRNHRRY